MLTEQRVILAADEFNREDLLAFVRQFGPRVFCVKIHSLYDLFGPGIVAELKLAGASRVWVDAKLYDIPNTVRLRAQAIAQSGADMLSVHASGGVEMLKAAKEGFGAGKVFGITALTSLTQQDVKDIYQATDPEALVMRLAGLAKTAGVNGVVCSPKEASMLHSRPEFRDLELVVPGIRSAGVDIHDQKRFDTPANAIKNGASYLVIGRQLTQAPDVAAALNSLEAELKLVIA
ncbi:MAG: orotidine-5'-phosphate decarboxylase [Patescibacteria group bacterium]|nr:orotidine-5'-phosphate decarboxylase [Patescibacteria group bacterium]